MYDHILYREKKTFLLLSFVNFWCSKTIKSHVNYCFKISVKQVTQTPKKVNVLDLKIMTEK